MSCNPFHVKTCSCGWSLHLIYTAATATHRLFRHFPLSLSKPKTPAESVRRAPHTTPPTRLHPKPSPRAKTGLLRPASCRLRRTWLYNLTSGQQCRRAAHAAHHSHLLGTDLRVQMTIPLQKGDEGRLTSLRRASTRLLAGQTTPIPTTHLEYVEYVFTE